MANYDLAALPYVAQYLLRTRSQIGRKAALLSVLPKKKGSGKVASNVIEIGGAVITNTPEGSPAPTASVDAETAYTHQFGSYDSRITITQKARRASGTVNQPPSGTGSYNAKYVEQVGKRVVFLLSQINRDFWGNSAANKITSVYDAVGDTTNTYGGINRATLGNEYWWPNVFDDGVPTTPTMDLIEEDLTAIRTNDYLPGEPDLVVLNPKIFKAVKSSLQGNVTYNIGAFSQGGIQEVAVQYGVRELAIGNTILMQDDHAPLDSILYLNSENCWLEYMPYPPDAAMAISQMFTDEMIAAIRQALAEANMDGDFMPFDMLMQALGATGSEDSSMLQCYPQFICDRPNACGMRLNISV